MRFLLLNQTFYPDVVSTAQHLADLATALAERGHDVTVITSRRAYDQPATEFPKTETWRGVKIIRVATTSFGKSAKWRRAADFASFILSCCRALLRVPRPHVVVTLTSPPLISFIGAVYARLRTVRFYYWVMDLNPDEAVAAGWLERGSPAANLLDWMSRASFHQAEKIIALDRFMKVRIEGKGIVPWKIAVIPPWSHDTAVRFDAEGRRKFREQHGLTDKFVVMYSGNHSPCHPLDTLMEAAGRLADNPRFAFVFVGGGSEFKRVQQFAGQHRLANILCLPYQPLHELSASLSAADLHCVVMGNPFVGIVHPCKIYNVLEVRAPVLYIGPTPSHLSELLGRLNSKVSGKAEHGDVEQCLAEIRRIEALGLRGEDGPYAQVVGMFYQNLLVDNMLELLGGHEISPVQNSPQVD